jgi:hypothetical protein
VARNILSKNGGPRARLFDSAPAAASPHQNVVSSIISCAIIPAFQGRVLAWEKNMPDNVTTTPLQDFLTPEAMLTPGVAGSMTMMITNALATNFDMPRAWLGLALSFVFGLLVLVSSKGRLVKGLFYVLNSLVIFCVAVGANGLGAAGPPVQASLLGIGPAYAQTAPAASAQDLQHCANIAATVEAAQKSGASSDKVLALIKPCQNLSQNILQGKTSSNSPTAARPAEQETSGKFFKPWKF